MLSIRKLNWIFILAFYATAASFLLLTPTAFAETVTLAWDRPDGNDVAGYNIYYGIAGTNYKDSPGKTIISPDQAQVEIPNLQPGETYAFSATSHDGNGNESDFSEEIAYTIPLPDHSITLAWDRPEDNAVVGYNIYYGILGTNYKDSPGKTINSPDQAQVEIPNLEPGKTYAFSATSHDGNGNESDFSEEITYTIPLSDDTDSYTITAGSGSGGSIDPAGDTLVSNGESVSYAISPHNGYQIDDVTINGSSVGSVGSYTISNITSDNTIYAIFSEIDSSEPEDEYFQGSGTTEDPFLILDSEQLDHVRERPDSHFKLMGDIDLGDLKSFLPIGSFASPFTGSFDGNGHIIKNIVIEAYNNDYIGFFGYLEDAIIKNTGIENADVVGKDYVGILAGYIVNTTISETYVTGFVSGQYYVGGLVGSMEADSSSLISNTYADCNVDGSAVVGGLIGNLAYIATIENAYAVGSVHGSSDIGGLVGQNNSELHDNVINSFWDIQLGPDTSKGGTGMTTAEMMEQATFTNWNFNGVWAIDKGRTYPYLQWQPEQVLVYHPNLINWDGNLVADFGDNGLWYHNGTSWNWMTNRGHVGQMVVWNGNLVVDFESDVGIQYYDGNSWHWMTNKSGAANMLSWHDGTKEKLVVDFGSGQGIYTYDGSWDWLSNKDHAANMAVWNNKLVIDFGNGRSVFNHDGSSWTWMTNKDDIALMLPWNDGSRDVLVVDFGSGRGIYSYDGSWRWLNSQDDINDMAVWNNKLVVDFGNGRGVFHYNGLSWTFMTDTDDIAGMEAWHDGTSDKLTLDFGGGRGIYSYDGLWHWMRNTDDVDEMTAWGNRLVVDFGSGIGLYYYDGAWHWMSNWSTGD